METPAQTHADEPDSNRLSSEHPAEEHVPEVLRVGAAYAWRIIVVTIVAIAVIWLGIQFSGLLIALMAAFLIAVIVEPVSAWMRNRLNWPPALAAAVTLVGLIVFIVGLIVGAGTSIVQGMSNISDQIQEGITQIVVLIEENFPQLQGQIADAWNQLQSTLKDNSGQIVGGVASVGSSVVSFFTGVVLCFFALFFFLKDGRRIFHWFVRLFPFSTRDTVNEAGIRAWVTVGSYMRTQAIIALVDAVGIAGVAMILQTPFSLAFPIFVLVFLFAFIPIVGAFLSGAIAVLVVLVNTGSLWMALAMLVGILLVQQIEGNVLQPVLQGNALNMHALAIFLIVTAGSAVAGIVGALFAVPLAAVINTVILYLKGHDTYPYLNSDPDRPGGPPEDFDSIAGRYWEQFDENVAQHESPKKRYARQRSEVRESLEEARDRITGDDDSDENSDSNSNEDSNGDSGSKAQSGSST